MRKINRLFLLLCTILPLAGCDFYNAHWEVNGNRPDVSTTELASEISAALAPLGFTSDGVNKGYYLYHSPAPDPVKVVVGPDLWIAIQGRYAPAKIVNQVLDAIQQRIKARYGITITWRASPDFT